MALKLPWIAPNTNADSNSNVPCHADVDALEELQQVLERHPECSVVALSLCADLALNLRIFAPKRRLDCKNMVRERELRWYGSKKALQLPLQSPFQSRLPTGHLSCTSL